MEQGWVVTVVSPLLTAALAAVGLLVKEWRQERRWEYRRDTLLEQSRKRVGFISEWAAAYERLAGERPDPDLPLTRAREDLSALYDTVSERLERLAEQRPRRRSVRSYARSILLTRVRRPWARAVRLIYYTSLVLALLLTLIVVPISFQQEDLPVLGQVAVLAIAVAIYFLPAVALHAVTRFLDRPRARDRQEVVAPPAGAPFRPGIPLGG